MRTHFKQWVRVKPVKKILLFLGVRGFNNIGQSIKLQMVNEQLPFKNTM